MARLNSVPRVLGRDGVDRAWVGVCFFGVFHLRARRCVYWDGDCEEHRVAWGLRRLQVPRHGGVVVDTLAVADRALLSCVWCQRTRAAGRQYGCGYGDYLAHRPRAGGGWCYGSAPLSAISRFDRYH